MELSVWLILAIVGIFMYFIFIKNNEYLKIINNYANRINSLEIEIGNLKGLIETLNISLIRKENEFTMFSSSKYNYPFPFWIKNIDGTMMYINKAYEKAFNITKAYYVGKKDNEVWGEEKAMVYRASDIEARNSPYNYKIFEQEAENWTVVKWSNKIGDVVVADYGCCFPSSTK